MGPPTRSHFLVISWCDWPHFSFSRSVPLSFSALFRSYLTDCFTLIIISLCLYFPPPPRLPPQFLDHGIPRLNECINLFRHDNTKPNILQLINAASEIVDDTLVEIVLSGKGCFSTLNEMFRISCHSNSDSDSRSSSSVANARSPFWLNARLFSLIWSMFVVVGFRCS